MSILETYSHCGCICKIKVRNVSVTTNREFFKMNSYTYESDMSDRLQNQLILLSVV